MFYSQILTMDDISKIPRLPGDGAQDDSDMQFNEISKEDHLTSSQKNATALMNNSTESPQLSVKGLMIVLQQLFDKSLKLNQKKLILMNG